MIRPRYIFPLLFLLLYSHWAVGQSFLGWQYNDRYFSVALGTGKSGYMGDLSHDKLFQKGLAQMSIGVEARLLKRISARTEFFYYNISGSDSKAADGSFPQQRNLSFYSHNWEWNLSGMYYLNPYAGMYYKRKPMDVYLHAGVGTTLFNPKTEFDGQTYALRQYKTENVAYSKFALVVPAGIGVKFLVNEFLNINAEVGYRVLFSDYLDDVSAKYGGPYDDKTSAALSNRNFEVGILNPEFYDRMVSGAQRGDDRKRDSYYFVSIKLEAYLPPDLLKRKGSKYSKESILKKPSGFDNKK